jgi:hypothetical protein
MMQESQLIVGLLSQRWPWLILLILLMLLNYGLESEKFRLLLRVEPPIGRLRSLMTIFAGVTISNFTPAKTGEYLGRSLMLKRQIPLKVIIATVAGNLLQMFWTYALGLLSFGLLLWANQLPPELGTYRNELLVAVLVVVGVLLTVRLFPFIQILLSSAFPASWKNSWKDLSSYRGKLLKSAVVLSGLRYLVFSTQYFLILYLFAEQGIPWYSLGYIPLIYLLQSLVPVPAAADIGFRIGFAQLFFGNMLTTGSLHYAVAGIWLINLILPAVLGAVYLLYSLKKKE